MTKICSECKREFGAFESFRLSFDVCPDCGGAVVPKEADIWDSKYVTIFVADGRGEAEEVRRRLDINKIPYVTRGDWESQKIYIDFLVKEDEAEEATALLKDIIDAEAVPSAPKAIFYQSQTDDERPNKVTLLILAFAVFALLVILLNYLVKK
ncbi:MAG: hypothetical protein PHO67_05460 [Candidatus Omnitrophica bacterium]|nr:hypothetical protein [Candidatus Omnitrophota bacterium]MDD5546584.1 hypothetical protein [Candidatus Omnitrophota bacterium]